MMRAWSFAVVPRREARTWPIYCRKVAFLHGVKRAGRPETGEDFLRSVEAIVEATLFFGP